MNIEQLYRDYGIQMAPASHKHYREGWVSVECPFCSGNIGYHLGYNIAEDYFTCWRCGWKAQKTAISAIIRVPIREVGVILRKYDYTPKTAEKPVKIVFKPFHLPSNSEPLSQRHKQYLIGRGFDPDKIEAEWGILGTGMYSMLENVSYKNRIIIPYTWDGQVVTFQGRDITNKHPMKYLACPEIREKKNIKTILYGNQNKWTDVGIVVEGVTDVWRLGTMAVGVSGIKYKPQQVRILAKAFKRVFIVFDSGENEGDEKQAQVQANKLRAELSFRGCEAINLVVKGDPGSMSQSDADALVTQCKSWKLQ